MATRKSNKKAEVMFPKMVYVYQESDGDESFFMVCESPQEIAVVGKKQLVGVYELSQTVIVEGMAQLTDVPMY